MPGPGISVAEFVRETREDQASPTTSTFVQRIPHCRETVTRVEEVRIGDGPMVCEVSDKRR
jgi:Arf-GAP/SH3 domain/ANK repeat/PH domain-containing protein